MTSDSRIKVVHMHKMDGISGSENHLRCLLSRLDQKRYLPTFLMLTSGKGADVSFMQELEDAGITVVTMPIAGDLDPVVLVKLVRWLRAERPMILHTHLIHGDFYGALAACLARVPILISTKHNDDEFRTRWGVRILERLLASRAVRIITISDWLRSFVTQMMPAAAGKIVTVHYGYDPSAPSTLTAEQVLGRFHIPPGAPLILSVGRLVRQKGQSDLLQAFSQVLTAVQEHERIFGSQPKGMWVP